jgi:DnaK suppressor protein
MKKTALHEAVLSLGHDAEYMSDEMINIFKESMISEVPLIQDRIATLEGTFGERNSEKYSDPVDIAQQQSDQNDTLFEISKCRKRITSISSALQVIKLGDYGYCADCGEEIGIGRMSTDATHTRDAECASRLEIKNANKFNKRAAISIR